MSAATHEVRWIATARAEEAAPLRRMVVAYATARGVPPAQLDEIALAVGEALANVVVHAYHGRAVGMLEVIARPSDGRLLITVRDEGRGLAPREDSPGLGLGLAMIAQVVDDLCICEGEGGGTEVRMTFAVDAAPGRVELADAEGDAA